jgi:hypothetical protein
LASISARIYLGVSPLSKAMQWSLYAVMMQSSKVVAALIPSYTASCGIKKWRIYLAISKVKETLK